MKKGVITIYKYYSQARRLCKWIPIVKPTSEFIIDRSDLTKRIEAELKTLDKKRFRVCFKASSRTNI